MVALFQATTRLVQGRSYWRVHLTTGKTVTEGQLSFDLLRGSRNVIWLEDIIGSGDNRNIRDITLCTPEGDITLPITEPYTAFQFQQGMVSFFGGERIPNAQVIGRVENKETGECTCVIWDVQGEEQSDGSVKHLFVNHITTVKDFASWRSGTPHIGKLYYEMVGLRGIE
jgi:hypothetical protein